MPVVAVNITANVYREIADLVSRGEYASPEDFLTTAAFNQLALERGAKPEALMQVSATEKSLSAETAEAGAGAVGAVVTNVDAPPRTTQMVAARDASRKRGGRHVAAEEAEQLLARLTMSAWPSTSARSLPDSKAASSQGRIWGQVNRLFPIKFAVRWLGAESASKGAWPELPEALERMSRDAALLGSYLDEDDQLAGRQRDDLLATGLPRQHNALSLERFRNQIVARVTRAGDVHAGAICQYHLADMTDGRIGLTEFGMQLASMLNPVLDGSSRVEGTLTSEERALFIKLIQTRLPVERDDARSALASVREGHASPEALQQYVRTFLPADWTDVMARTHTSGLVSRVADMGLLKRRWIGRNVRYELTDAGIVFLGGTGGLDT